MKRLIIITVSLLCWLTSYSQANKLRISQLPPTYGVQSFSLFLMNQGNNPDTSKKVTGSQLIDYIFTKGPTNTLPVNVAPDTIITNSGGKPSKSAIEEIYYHASVAGVQSQSAPSYVMTEGADGKIARTQTATSGFAFGVFSGYGSGTAYPLTSGATSSITFGGGGAVQPNITLSAAGTYMLLTVGIFNYNGYAFGSTNIINFRLRRTNNTAADLANSTTSIPVPIIAAAYSMSESFPIVPIIYTTANTNDAIAVTGQLVTTIGITGNITVSSCGIVAIRLY